MNRRSRQKKLKIILISTVFFAVILSLFVLFYLPYLRNQAVSNLLHQKVTELASHYKEFLKPVETNLHLLRVWGRQEVFDLDPEQAQDAKNMLIPLLNRHLPQVTGLILAQDNGPAFLLDKKGDEWKWNLLEGIDDFHSPWLRDAINNNRDQELYWAPFYQEHSSSQSGLIVSTKYIKQNQDQKDDENIYVIGLKISIKSMQEMVDSLPISDDTQLFLISEDYISDISRSQLNTIHPLNDIFLSPMKILEVPEINTGLMTWRDNQSPLGQPFSFRIKGRKWWMEVMSIDMAGAEKIGFIIPDQTLMIETGQIGVVIFYAVIAGLIVLLMIVMIFLRRYSREAESVLDRKKHTDDSGEDILSLISKGENSELEFKSNLRWNKKTEKPDKNIELASMKTLAAFLNSDGGTLLIGIDDKGNIVGFNEDRFNVRLIKISSA